MIASSRRRVRSRLLATCVFALSATPVVAQTYSDRALQGDSTVVSGTVTVGRTPLRDTITVASAQAIINWNPETGTAGVLPPSPAPINFLPNGREAVFQGATVGQDFVVLNRILPSTNRPIAINGTVTSQIVTGFSTGSPPVTTYARGGSVWFYSPGGIIAGPTAVFNVGNLILTANDIDATGGLFAPGGVIRFRGAVNSVGAVTVQPGAQFNQPRAGSYLALVAPQVTMGGTATVNGSAAYVAAEQVDVTVNGGLFDMSFLAGTTVANALTHTGTTTGPAQTAGRIAMAAMPKNTAVTLLVGGTIGYAPAATATVQNGTVVLSAGYNLSQGRIDSGLSDRPGGNIVIGNTNFTSSVFGSATGTLDASPTSSGTLAFSSSATLGGEVLVSIGADSGETVTVGGDLSLSAAGASGAGTARLYAIATPGSPLAAPSVTVTGTASLAADVRGRTSETGESVAAGTAQVVATGGNLTFGSGLTLSATAFGGDAGVTGGNGTGGRASLAVNGGTVTIGEPLNIRADGFGGGGIVRSGNGIGGTASVTLGAGTVPTVLNLTGFGHQISANGGVNGQFPSVDGGNAVGGSALLTINSGTMTAIDLTLTAFAAAGEAQAGTAGNASGGIARVQIGGGRFDVGTLSVNAEERQASAGDGGTAGGTTGSGLAAVDVSGAGVLSVGANGGNSLTINANAIKASLRLGLPVGGGALNAGTARLTAVAGGSILTDATAPSAPKPPVLVTASVLYNDSDPGAPSASQRAGSAIVNVDGGTMSLHKLDIRANALVRDFPVPTDNAGPGFGGTATLAARNGGSITLLPGAGTTPVSAYGTGGSTNTPALGTGGAVNVIAQGGTLALPDGLAVDVRGFSGTTLGGNGGTVTVQSVAGTAGQPGSLTAGATTLDASGQLSAGLPNGTAGNITVTNTGQTMRFASLFARAGAANGTPGGSITLNAENAAITTVAPGTGIDVGTLGTLTLHAVGPAGTITGSTGIYGYGNDILVSHAGVTTAAQSTISGPTIRLEAGRDQIHTGAVTLRSGTVTLVGRRLLGGIDSSVFATGNIELGSGLLATSNRIDFAILDAGGLLRGYQGASSFTPEVTTPGIFVIGNRIFARTGNIDVRANTGVDIADAATSATGQVLLSSSAGNVTLSTSGVFLTTRPGAIVLTAAGMARFTDIFSRTAILVSGQAIAGGNATAATDIALNATSGAIGFGRLVAGGSLFATASGTITGTSATATTGPLTLTGPLGITVPTVVSGGAVTLNAVNGAVTVATNLQPGGTATAIGQSIFLRSLGALTFSSLNATAGNLDVASVGALSVSTPQATGSVTLASTGGNTSFGSGSAGTSFSASAAGAVNGASATATAGPVTLTGATGISVPTIVSGGTTTLTAVNGAINVATNLRSAGLVTANGRSVLLRANGALTADTLTATAGALDVQSAGALGVTTAQASTSVNFASTGGNVALGSSTAGTTLTVTSPGNVSGTAAIATSGALSVTGTNGIDIGTVGGTSVTLGAANGPVRVATDLRTANPTISGQSLFLRSVGQMGIGSLTATGPGGIDAAAGGSMQMTSVQSANGPVRLSAATLLNIQALTSGGTTVLNAANGAVNATNLRSAGLLSAAGQSVFVGAVGPLTASTLTATAGAATLQVINGPLSVGTTAATGAVTLSSSNGAIAFGTVQSGGNALVQAGTTVTGTSLVSGGFATVRGSGNLSVQNVQATGSVQLITSTGAATITVGTAIAGTYLEARGAALNFGTVTAGTDVLLSSFNGGLSVGDVTAGDDIFLTVNGSNANPATISPDSQTGVVSTTVNTLVAGNLRSTGLGSDTAVSGPQTFGPGAGPTGNVIRVRASGAVQTGSITTAGTAIIASDLATIATQAITATIGVSLFVRGNATTGDITTAGNFSLGDASQFFSAVPAYQPFAFGFSQTATSGGATLGAVTAANIGSSTRDTLTFSSLTATGFTSWVSTLGSITGGRIAAGGPLSLRAGGNIAFTTATAGTSAFMVAGGSLTGTSVTAADGVDTLSQTGLALTFATSTGSYVTLGTIANELRVGAVTAATDVTIGATDGVTSSANVILGTVTSGRNTRIEGGNAFPGSVASGAITTGGMLDVSATSLALGNIASGGAAVLTSNGGAISTGMVTAANFVANATGNLTTGRVTSAEDIRLSTGAAPALLVTGDLTAGDDIIATGNAITTGNLVTTGLGRDAEGTGSAIDFQFNRITTGTVESAGSILFAASQPIRFTSTNSRSSTIIRSFGAITGGNSTTGTTLEIQGGSIDTGNGQAGGALNYSNFNAADTIRTGTLSGATVTASSRGTLATGAVTAPAAINLFGDLGLTVASATSATGAVQLSAQTSGPISSGALRAGTTLGISAQSGSVALTTLDAGGRISLRAGGGTLRFDRATTAGAIGFSATGNIDFGTLVAGDSIQIQTPGTLTGVSATLAGGAPNIVQGDAGVTLPTLTTNGVTLLTATNGAVSIAGDFRSTGAVTATGRSVSIRSSGALVFDGLTATAGAASVTTSGSLTLSSASATTALNLIAGGTATFNGAATGATITVAAPDIVISAQGRLGSLGTTTQLTLSSNSTQNRTTIGGTGGGTGTTGYNLSAAEIGRLFGGNITIVAPVIGGQSSTAINSARVPDVLIEAFSFAANTNLGPSGTFSIDNGGKVRVVGAVGFTGVAGGQAFSVRGDEAIEVLDAGSIVLGGASGLAGTLALTSRNIVAASSAALADFTGAADLQAISDRAAKNDGAINEGGYLQAGGIRATLLNSTLIIQNTGAATTTGNRDYAGRRGFTVGAGGFTIIQGSSNPVRIAINGRQVGATTPLGAPTADGFVTGLDLTPLIRFQPFSITAQPTLFTVGTTGLSAAERTQAAAIFDPVSTSNGCAIVSASACRTTINDPIRDILLGDFGEDAVGKLLPLALIQLKEYVTPGDEPLIDEPVTGAGNDDLWSVDDTKPVCDPAKEKCPA